MMVAAGGVYTYPSAYVWDASRPPALLRPSLATAALHVAAIGLSHVVEQIHDGRVSSRACGTILSQAVLVAEALLAQVLRETGAGGGSGGAGDEGTGSSSGSSSAAHTTRGISNNSSNGKGAASVAPEPVCSRAGSKAGHEGSGSSSSATSEDVGEKEEEEEDDGGNVLCPGPSPVELAHTMAAAAQLMFSLLFQSTNQAWSATWAPYWLRLFFHVVALRRVVLTCVHELNQIGVDTARTESFMVGRAAVTELEVFQVALGRTRAMETVDTVRVLTPAGPC